MDKIWATVEQKYSTLCLEGTAMGQSENLAIERESNLTFLKENTDVTFRDATKFQWNSSNRLGIWSKYGYA
jgi:hypothetical protein